MTDLNSYGKTAVVVRELMELGRITSSRVRELTGMRSRQGARKLLCDIAIVLPILYDEDDRYWKLIGIDTDRCR